MSRTGYWFLVVFGNKVTKILCNSLFFLLSKARQAKMEHMEMHIQAYVIVERMNHSHKQNL